LSSAIIEPACFEEKAIASGLFKSRAIGNVLAIGDRHTMGMALRVAHP
jgi:hypothetical protein